LPDYQPLWKSYQLKASHLISIYSSIFIYSVLNSDKKPYVPDFLADYKIVKE